MARRTTGAEEIGHRQCFLPHHREGSDASRRTERHSGAARGAGSRPAPGSLRLTLPTPHTTLPGRVTMWKPTGVGTARCPRRRAEGGGRQRRSCHTEQMDVPISARGGPTALAPAPARQPVSYKRLVCFSTHHPVSAGALTAKHAGAEQTEREASLGQRREHARL